MSPVSNSHTSCSLSRPKSRRESVSFRGNRQPRTSRPDEGLWTKAYLFISILVREENVAGGRGHVRERVQDVCQLAWVNVRRFCAQISHGQRPRRTVRYVRKLGTYMPLRDRR